MPPVWLARWKTRGSMELRHYQVPLAVKEYVVNQIKQVLREKGVKHWSKWVREDLRNSTNDVRSNRKRQLVETYPGLLPGHYRTALESEAWLPIYILTATIPHSDLKDTPFDTNLELCIVTWRHQSGLVGITFYNNHLPETTHPSHFIVDGATTELSNKLHPDSGGVGFIHATQFLQEELDRHLTELEKTEKPHIEAENTGICFRIGHQLGMLNWCKNEGVANQLGAKVESLVPSSLEGILASGDTDSSKGRRIHENRVVITYNRRFALGLSVKATGVDKATEPSHEIPLIKADEVVITILGLPSKLTPEHIFSGVFGVMRQPRTWKIQNRTPHSPTIHFFKPSEVSPSLSRTPDFHEPPFYHRDQLILSGPPLNKLGINYVGDLLLTGDRTIVITAGPLFDEYKRHLSAAVDLAFRTMPELAVELAVDILTDHGNHDGTISRVLTPADTEGKDAYRRAFTAAWRRLDPSLSDDEQLFPVSGAEAALVQELGKTGRPVHPHVKTILARSGAYPDIRLHAESLLLQARSCSIYVPGVDRLRRALATLLPGVTENQLAVRQFNHSQPTIVWDMVTEAFVMGVPAPCENHGDGGCVCWVGPYLADAVASWENRNAGDEMLSKAAMYRVYLNSMEGVHTDDMQEPSNSKNEEVNGNTSPPPQPAVNDEDEDDNELGYITVVSHATTPMQATLRAYGTPRSISPRRVLLTPASPDRRTSSVPALVAAATSSQSPRRTPALEAPPPKTNDTGSTSHHPPTEDNCDTIEDLWQDMKERIEKFTHARLDKERRSAQEKENAVIEQVTHLQAVSDTHERERREHLQALETKGKELMECDLLLQRKDETIRDRDARIAQQKQSLKSQARRIRKLEDNVNKLENRERVRAQKLQTELESMKRRISVAFSEHEEEEYEEKDPPEEPPSKKLRSD
ncbi:hypothetical protein BKA93DRAFT_822161 [Sparassis latifolia]